MHLTCQENQTDENHDGWFDELNLEITMPLDSGEEVFEARLLLFFDYRLHVRTYFRVQNAEPNFPLLQAKVKLHMESMAHITHRSLTSGDRLDVLGELKLGQRELVMSTGHNLVYNYSIIRESKKGDLDLEEALREHFYRNRKLNNNLMKHF